MEIFTPTISITFMLTTFLCVGILFYAIKRSVLHTTAAKLVVFLIGFWLLFTAILAKGGFYESTDSFPPRAVLFGVLPANLLIVALFIFFRGSFVEKLPLKTLTILHIVRIPVEIVLLWCFQQSLVPRAMTFEGSNFDILSGVTTPIVYLIAFRGKSVNRPLLIVWNLLALGFLANIVITALLADWLKADFDRVLQGLQIDNTSLTFVVATPKAAKLWVINDTDHLAKKEKNDQRFIHRRP